MGPIVEAVDGQDLIAGRVKFLASWVETNGNVRGQTCKTREEADRLFKFVSEQETTAFVEIRRIGTCVDSYYRKLLEKTHTN